MMRMTVNGTELAFEMRGRGSPLVLLHCGFLADGNQPLFEDPVLASNHTLIHVHRRGYGESARAEPVPMAGLAADIAALLDGLGIERAHVFGHSFGGCVAMELALQQPDRLRSLLIAEPSLPGFPRDPDAMAFLMGVIGQAVEHLQAEKPGEAIDTWLDVAFAAGWQAHVEAAIPNYRATAIADVMTMFGTDVAALQSWQLDEARIRELRVPTLSISQRTPSWSGFRETHDALLEWLPNARAALIPDVSHLLHVQRPRAVVDAIVAFTGSR